MNFDKAKSPLLLVLKKYLKEHWLEKDKSNIPANVYLPKTGRNQRLKQFNLFVQMFQKYN